MLLLLNQRLHPLEWVSQLERSRATVLIAETAFLEQLQGRDRAAAAVRTVVAIDGPGGDLTLRRTAVRRRFGSSRRCRRSDRPTLPG